jgi:hypothetical protein
MGERGGYRRAAMLAMVLALGAATAVAGCGGRAGGGSRAAGASPAASESAPPPSPAPEQSVPPSSGAPAAPPAATGPALRPALDDYVRKLPGTLGVQVHDRVTGATWQAGDTGFATWTASTIKLAIATALLERNRAGSIALTAGDRTTMRSMLVDSSNDATDALWEKYDGVGMLPTFRDRYGMANLAVVAGYRPYWRHLQCSTTDLTAVLTYALGALAAADRADLVGWLRAAAGTQPWGLWAAGAANKPGHKPGWAFKPEGRPTHWVVHSVGFAGANERYVVAVMYDLPAGRTAKDGAQAVSDVVALAFGRPLAAVRGP